MYHQKPFSSHLSLQQWGAVVRYSLVTLLANVTWFYGLTLCGPLRTILISEHSAAALALGFMALFCQGKPSLASQARTRGAFLFLMATLAMLLVDHDDNSPHHQVRL